MRGAEAMLTPQNGYPRSATNGMEIKFFHSIKIVTGLMIQIQKTTGMIQNRAYSTLQYLPPIMVMVKGQLVATTTTTSPALKVVSTVKLKQVLLKLLTTKKLAITKSCMDDTTQIIYSSRQAGFRTPQRAFSWTSTRMRLSSISCAK